MLFPVPAVVLAVAGDGGLVDMSLCRGVRDSVRAKEEAVQRVAATAGIMVVVAGLWWRKMR